MPRKNEGKRKCLSCKYRYQASGAVEVCCQYILIMGHHRPCKGGDKCTEYVKSRKGKRG